MIWALLALAASGVATETFPGPGPDAGIIRTQEKVNSLFDQGQFERAYFIYRQELAPLGDKYSQYMVG